MIPVIIIVAASIPIVMVIGMVWLARRRGGFLRLTWGEQFERKYRFGYGRHENLRDVYDD
jgi:hypothetical protein